MPLNPHPHPATNVPNDFHKYCVFSLGIFENAQPFWKMAIVDIGYNIYIYQVYNIYKKK